MEITKQLQELAKFSSDTLPVISVYLTAPGQDHHPQDQGASFLRHHLRQARVLTMDSEAARASLDRDLRRLAQWAEEHLQQPTAGDTAGYALFTCSGADVWVEFPSPLPFDHEFVMSDRPVLRQLARLDADYTNALVVLVATRAIRVCEVVLGGLLAETDFSGEVAERFHLEHWAQLRYQRDVKTEIERSYTDAAVYLDSYLGERQHTLVILTGEPDAVQQFQRFLAPRVQRQVVHDVSLDTHATPQRIAQIARQVVERYERHEEQEDVKMLLTSAARGGLAVVGLPATLTAVNAGAVHKLFLQQHFQRTGRRCVDCDNLEEGTPQQCTVCAGEVQTVELGEAMITEVLRHDGTVEPVAADTRLATYDGVGALLRYHSVVQAIKE